MQRNKQRVAKELISYTEHSRKWLHPRFRHNKTYHIVVVDSPMKQQFFDYYCKQIYEDDSLRGYCILDFEFNTKQVATIQMNIELMEESELFIFVFDPRLYNSYSFVQHILTNPRLTKVIHGGDSLDMPYLVSIMSKSEMRDFLKQCIDTRFICAFIDASCKIYNMLLHREIITQKTFDLLEDNEEKMGKIYDITIDIQTINSPEFIHLLRYSVFDVIFLGYVVEDYKQYPQFDIWRRLVQHSYLEKRGIIDYQTLDSKIATWNIGRLLNKKSLHDLFSEWWGAKVGAELKEELEGYMRNGFVKRMVMRILKYAFYTTVAKRMRIYASLREDIPLEITEGPADLHRLYPGLSSLIKKIEAELAP